MAVTVVISLDQNYSLMKLFLKVTDKRTTAPSRLNRGGSDSFFAGRIFVLYDF
jgi:hypothetical protein